MISPKAHLMVSKYKEICSHIPIKPKPEIFEGFMTKIMLINKSYKIIHVNFSSKYLPRIRGYKYFFFFLPIQVNLPVFLSILLLLPVYPKVPRCAVFLKSIFMFIFIHIDIFFLNH